MKTKAGIKVLSELMKTVAQLAALEARTHDVIRSQERIERKLDDLLQRVTAIEVERSSLKTSLKNEILAEISAFMTKVQLDVEHSMESLSLRPDYNKIENPKLSE